jgi:SnoaL-like domain
MTLDNEQIVRKAYQIAEDKDLKGWADAFTADGTFTDNSIGVVYRGPDGPDGLPVQVENYARAFPDMHRELYQLYVTDNVVVVQLARQGRTSARWTCLSGRCGRPASGWTHPAVTSSSWPTARSSASTATPKARLSSPSSA